MTDTTPFELSCSITLKCDTLPLLLTANLPACSPIVNLHRYGAIRLAA
jgi:hypothetical protein